MGSRHIHPSGTLTLIGTSTNLVISGLNLAALRGRQVAIGEAVLQITGPCAPCSRMEVALGPGGYNAMRGHGGWCATVLRPAHIVIGDVVEADPG